MTDKRRLWIPHSAAEAHATGKDALLSLDAKIQPDFKRAIGLGILALICLGAGDNLGGVRRHDSLKWVTLLLLLAFALLGAAAVRSAGREVYRITSARSGLATAAALRFVVSAVGYALVLLGVLQLANVSLASLLVGGAVTGIILGIAAQQSLGSFFAGLVLLFARPYVAGERVIIRSGSMGGPFEGTIVDTGLLYTTIVTAEGPINLPNLGLLAAAVGPAPEHAEGEDLPSPAPGP
jgi:small-conductance mechanosensitive channel